MILTEALWLHWFAQVLRYLQGCCGCSVASLVRAGYRSDCSCDGCSVCMGLLSLVPEEGRKVKDALWPQRVVSIIGSLLCEVTGQTETSLTLTVLPSRLPLCSSGQLDDPSSSIRAMSSLALYSRPGSLTETCTWCEENSRQWMLRIIHNITSPAAAMSKTMFFLEHYLYVLQLISSDGFSSAWVGDLSIIQLV